VLLRDVSEKRNLRRKTVPLSLASGRIEVCEALRGAGVALCSLIQRFQKARREAKRGEKREGRKEKRREEKRKGKAR
jgi:hypothetical protein